MAIARNMPRQVQLGPVATSNAATRKPTTQTNPSTARAVSFINSKDDLANVRQHRDQEGGEARRGGAVDHAVVVGERERKDQTGLEDVFALLALSGKGRFQSRARDAEDRHFRRVDDRREGGAADAAQARDRE